MEGNLRFRNRLFTIMLRGIYHSQKEGGKEGKTTNKEVDADAREELGIVVVVVVVVVVRGGVYVYVCT